MPWFLRFDVLQELSTYFRRALEEPAVAGRHGRAALVLNASAGHAQVLGVHDNSDVLGAEDVLQSCEDLPGQTLLHLGPFGVVVHNAVELAQTHNAPLRDVGHVRHADDGQEVVLARGVQRDVTLDQHVVVSVHIVERLDVWMVGGVEAAKNLLHVHLGHPVGRACQAVVRQVETENLHDVAELGLDGLDFVFVAHVEGIGTQGGIDGGSHVFVADGIDAVVGILWCVGCRGSSHVGSPLKRQSKCENTTHGDALWKTSTL